MAGWFVVIAIGLVACGSPSEPQDEPVPSSPTEPDPTEPDPTEPDPPPSFADVAPGVGHTCALASDGAAFCWGQNFFGQLGIGTEDDALRPVEVVGDHVFTALATGEHHTCGVTDEDEVWCWGNNTAGQLGQGSTGSNPTSMPELAVGLPLVGSITAGSAHACALDRTGIAWCWGRIGIEMRETVPAPIAVHDSIRFVQLSAGAKHTCGITDDRDTVCWGQNLFGQLGSSASSDSISVVAAPDTLASVSGGQAHSCGLTGSGEAVCWGSANHGQLGNGEESSGTQYPPTSVLGANQFTQISASASRTCGLTTSGDGYCWGGNYAGGLGDGSTQLAAEPVPVAGGVEFDVIRAGAGATCGVAVSGELYCWGPNLVGQVGDGTTVSRLVPTKVTP